MRALPQRGARLIGVHGEIQSDKGGVHVIANVLVDLTVHRGALRGRRDPGTRWSVPATTVGRCIRRGIFFEV